MTLKLLKKKNIADSFNKYFVGVGKTLANSILETQKDPKSYIKTVSSQSMYIKPVTEKRNKTHYYRIEKLCCRMG